MGDCSWPHPQTNSTFRRRLLEIVDDQGGPFNSVDIKPRDLSCYLDFYLRPLPGDEVRIRFILAGGFTAQFFPWESRNRNVLGGVVPLKLILGTPVLRPEIEALEMRRIGRSRNAIPTNPLNSGAAFGAVSPLRVTSIVPS